MTGFTNDNNTVSPTITLSPGEASLSNGRLVIEGDWTLANYAQLQASVKGVSRADLDTATVDLSKLGRVDTAGATQLIFLVGPERLYEFASAGSHGIPEETSALLRAVSQAMSAKPAPPAQSA